MMKNYLRFLLVSLVGFMGIIACNDFLNVKPRNKYLNSQVFNSESGIKSQLNGVYMGMAKKSLYGGNLTMSTLEILAQQYKIRSQSHDWFQYATYSYDESEVMATMDNIWSDAYRLILNINDFIKSLDNTEGVISERKSKLLKGEAYGLRAMLHFDLLR